VGSFIFGCVKFRGLAETEMVVDICIHGFDACKWLLLLIVFFFCT